MLFRSASVDLASLRLSAVAVCVGPGERVGDDVLVHLGDPRGRVRASRTA